jgi:rubrerythrin
MENLNKKQFERRVEDFVCSNCGAEVVGNGYTNHCPECLWSKHVDVNPGDRSANCGGMMEPVSLEKKNGSFYIVHECEKCGHVKNNKTVEGDNFDVLVKLSNKD